KHPTGARGRAFRPEEAPRRMAGSGQGEGETAPEGSAGDNAVSPGAGPEWSGMGRQGFGALVSDEQWTRFLRAGVTRRFAPGERIVRQGERGDAVYMLAEGTVKVSMVRTDGTEALLALRGPGEAL